MFTRVAAPCVDLCADKYTSSVTRACALLIAKLDGFLEGRESHVSGGDGARVRGHGQLKARQIWLRGGVDEDKLALAERVRARLQGWALFVVQGVGGDSLGIRRHRRGV